MAHIMISDLPETGNMAVKITAEYFEQATGRKPEQDDLDRSNCPLAGRTFHDCCGWDDELNLPVFEAMAVRLRNRLEKERGRPGEGAAQV